MTNATGITGLSSTAPVAKEATGLSVQEYQRFALSPAMQAFAKDLMSPKSDGGWGTGKRGEATPDLGKVLDEQLEHLDGGRDALGAPSLATPGFAPPSVARSDPLQRLAHFKKAAEPYEQAFASFKSSDAGKAALADWSKQPADVQAGAALLGRDFGRLAKLAKVDAQTTEQGHSEIKLRLAFGATPEGKAAMAAFFRALD